MFEHGQKNLVLIGFMGAGKSTIGKLLADKRSWRFVDLDHMIELQAGRSIKEIFSTEGEFAFRNIEQATLRALCGQTRCVIATGGGVVGRPENWVVMRQLGPTIYLQAQWQTLIERLSGFDHRPLAQPTQAQHEIRNLYERRLSLYEQADFIVSTDQREPQAVVDEIIRRIEGY